MKILFIAPLPPPHTGNSLPIKVLLDLLSGNHSCSSINTSKNAHKSGNFSIGRIKEIIRILVKVFMHQREHDLIYLSIAESFAGNIRDIIIYLICSNRLDSIIVHMFGGAGMNKILNNTKSIQYKCNKYFLEKIGAIVVEGETQADMFSKVANPENVYFVKNFAEEYLFSAKEDILKNFKQLSPIRVIFLSNMLYGKGYKELLTAYQKLTVSEKQNVEIDFAGKFPDMKDEREFKETVSKYNNLRYHGSVSGTEKKKLYSQAHVFCLPTYYPYEGQPFSILEAYASGCVVITTNHSGIRNVFKDEFNGFEVKKRSVSSLVAILKATINKKDGLCDIALRNSEEAIKYYNVDRYKKEMANIINNLLIK